MEVKVFLRNLRIAPRKTRQVADLVRTKKVAEARALLEFTVKGASDPILRLLNSAVASAINDFQLEESNLYISKLMIDEGPKLKRSNPESRGRAFPILKRTSHIMLMVSEINPTKRKTEPMNTEVMPSKLVTENKKETKEVTAKAVTKRKVTSKVKK